MASTVRLSSSTYMQWLPDLHSWPLAWALVSHIIWMLSPDDQADKPLECPKQNSSPPPQICFFFFFFYSESIGSTTSTQARNLELLILSHSLHLINYQILPISHPLNFCGGQKNCFRYKWTLGWKGLAGPFLCCLIPLAILPPGGYLALLYLSRMQSALLVPHWNEIN